MSAKAKLPSGLTIKPGTATHWHVTYKGTNWGVPVHANPATTHKVILDLIKLLDMCEAQAQQAPPYFN